MAELLEPSNNLVEFVHVEKDRYNSFRGAVTLSELRGSGKDIAPCDIPAQFNNTFPRILHWINDRTNRSSWACTVSRNLDRRQDRDSLRKAR